MSKKKPVYKIVDGLGRVHIPKALRESADMNIGDIVRIDVRKGAVTAKKVDIIEWTTIRHRQGTHMCSQQSRQWKATSGFHSPPACWSYWKRTSNLAEQSKNLVLLAKQPPFLRRRLFL